MKKPKVVRAANITLDAKPREFELLSNRVGDVAKADGWNARLFNLVTTALPIDPDISEASNNARTAVCQAMVDMVPADPVEAILVSQLLVASEASLGLYNLAWRNTPHHFEAAAKFMQLADKAARTAALLTERLDHHRGRGQQQITVKHVTTNNVTADQAIIAESVTTGGKVSSPALRAVNSAPAMPILDHARQPALVGGGGSAEKK